MMPTPRERRRLAARIAAWIALVALPATTALPAGQPEYPHGEFQDDCTACHGSQGWTPAVLSPDFDHGASGFALEGNHSRVDCRSCHISLEFRAAPDDCASCHLDPHEGELGLDCGDCHTPRSFIDRTAMVRNHLTTRFPLNGAHRTIDCEQCHGLSSAGALRFVGTPVDCVSCHESDYESTVDPNHVTENFPRTCETCHSVRSFVPAGFNHANLPASAQCVDCHLDDYNAAADPNHVTGNFPQQCEVCHSTTTWVPAGFNHANLPASARCADCHTDDFNATVNPNHQAAGFPLECQVCHSTNTWVPATFDGLDHDGLFFPIYSGRHRNEWNECTDCHVVPNNFAAFECIQCHEHSNQGQVDDDHSEVNGYMYTSQLCYSCHPQGRN